MIPLIYLGQASSFNQTFNLVSQLSISPIFNIMFAIVILHVGFIILRIIFDIMTSHHCRYTEYTSTDNETDKSSINENKQEDIKYKLYE
jgi:succinate dehydrogenase/fumarate reductase cytochrome b subunit